MRVLFSFCGQELRSTGSSGAPVAFLLKSVLLERFPAAMYGLPDFFQFRQPRQEKGSDVSEEKGHIDSSRRPCGRRT